MQSVDEALFDRLSGDAPLLAAAPGGVWRTLAPVETAKPFVIFRKAAPDEDKYTMTGLSHRFLTYEVAAVDQSPSAEAAQAALELAEALLQDADASLSMTGWSVGSIRRRSNIEDHFNDPGGNVWQTTVSTFRIMVVPA